MRPPDFNLAAPGRGQGRAVTLSGWIPLYRAPRIRASLLAAAAGF